LPSLPRELQAQVVAHLQDPAEVLGTSRDLLALAMTSRELGETVRRETALDVQTLRFVVGRLNELARHAAADAEANRHVLQRLQSATALQMPDLREHLVQAATSVPNPFESSAGLESLGRAMAHLSSTQAKADSIEALCEGLACFSDAQRGRLLDAATHFDGERHKARSIAALSEGLACLSGASAKGCWRRLRTLPRKPGVAWRWAGWRPPAWFT
jgi:hypothetical protein